MLVSLICLAHLPSEPTWHDGLEDYKFGDSIKGWNARPNIGYNYFIDYCCAKFPGSIVCDYRRMTKSFSNISVLKNISTRRARLYHNAQSGCLSLPDPESLVIQLRLGDVMKANDCFFRSKRCQGRDNKLIASHCWNSLKRRYTQTFHRPITIVSNHQRVRNNRKGVENSLSYRNDVLAWLKAHFNNTDVSLRDDCQPDHDFVFATHARYLLASRGGFSTLINATAVAMGATVLRC